MVCKETYVMSVDQATEVATTCNSSIFKIQSVAELLLLTSDLRPCLNDSSFKTCKDTIITRIKHISVLVNDITMHLHSISGKWVDVCSSLHELTRVITEMTEYTSNAAYIISLNDTTCSPAKPGIIDSYRVNRAGIDISHCCHRLRNSTIEQLSPSLLISICSEISRNLSILTDCCRVASEKTSQQSDSEQFKLCVKSMTSIASCLLSSIKSFRGNPSDCLHQRCVRFSEALISVTSALVNFATESQFIGEPAIITPDTKTIQNSLLGSCMGVVSSCVQTFKTLQSLAYDNKNIRYRGRVNLCLESITKTTNRLTETLLSCDDSSMIKMERVSSLGSVPVGSVTLPCNETSRKDSSERNHGDGASSNRSSGSWGQESSDS